LTLDFFGLLGEIDRNEVRAILCRGNFTSAFPDPAHPEGGPVVGKDQGLVRALSLMALASSLFPERSAEEVADAVEVIPDSGP
jgi:hypothetical protein